MIKNVTDFLPYDGFCAAESARAKAFLESTATPIPEAWKKVAGNNWTHFNRAKDGTIDLFWLGDKCYRQATIKVPENLDEVA